ncbi:MAG: hypothetical protein AABW52_06240 [Nanoarchaeota archaeon]
MSDFDYYIFIDYSEEVLGYFIIKKEEIVNIMPKISKFSHYRELKYKKAYLNSIRRIIEENKIIESFLKLKITEIRHTLEIYADLVEFLKNNSDSLIFISIDDNQYSNFERLVKNVGNNKIVKEGQLKKYSKEYKLSLIIDTLVNIKRLKKK